MTITSVNNRHDWYIAIQKQGRKTFVGYGTTRMQAVRDVLTQLKLIRIVPVVFLSTPFEVEMQRFA